jgi:hypothetical protein
MSTRANDLADRFLQGNQAVISAIEGDSERELRSQCAGEGCTVASLAYHVAEVHGHAMNWIQTAAAGDTMPQITMDMVNTSNAEQFPANANRGKEEIPVLLRNNDERATEEVCNLSDDELDRTVDFALTGGPISTQGVVENILIYDVESNLASIRAAINGAP